MKVNSITYLSLDLVSEVYHNPINRHINQDKSMYHIYYTHISILSSNLQIRVPFCKYTTYSDQRSKITQHYQSESTTT